MRLPHSAATDVGVLIRHPNSAATGVGVLMRLPHSAATSVGVLIRHPNSAATSVGVSYGTRILLRQASEYHTAPEFCCDRRRSTNSAPEFCCDRRRSTHTAPEFCCDRRRSTHTAPEFRCDRRWSTDTGGLFFAQCFRGLHVAELTSRDVDAQTHHDNKNGPGKQRDNGKVYAEGFEPVATL